MAMMMRFKFTRGPELKFISHLDVLRVFERSIKRAGVPIAYSQGFNPRQKLIFGLPMSLGLTSECEYGDIEFTEDITPEYFIETINKGLPTGIRVIDAVDLTTKDNIMNQITSARYEIIFESIADIKADEINELIGHMLNKDQIVVMKKSKNGKRPVDIKPLIYSIYARKYQNGLFLMEAFISAGAQDNLRADLLMQAVCQETKLELIMVSTHRKALYASVLNKWKDPFEVANG